MHSDTILNSFCSLIGRRLVWCGGRLRGRLLIPADQLVVWTASMLFLSGVLIWVRTRLSSTGTVQLDGPDRGRFWPSAAGAGLVTGGLSGLFGIGSIVDDIFLIVIINLGAQIPLWAISFLMPSTLRASGDSRFTSMVSMLSMWLFRIVLG